MSKFLTGTIATVAVASIAANVLLYERYSSSRPLVRVGNEVITKRQYQDAVDYQTQGNVLKTMVYAKLVMQAAAKAGVMPSDKDVDTRIAQIRRQGQGPDMQALAAADQDQAKMADLKRNLMTTVALENLAIQDQKASESEIAAFYASHKNAFALPKQQQTTLVLTQNPVDAATAESLLKQGTQPDVIARQPRLSVVGVNGFNPNLQAFSPADRQRINATVFGMKPGTVKTIVVKTPSPDKKQLSEYDLTFRVNKSLGAGIAPLSQVHDQVARFVKAEKAGRNLPQGMNVSQYELAKLYEQSKPQFTSDKYAVYFADIENAASAARNAKKTASVR